MNKPDLEAVVPFVRIHAESESPRECCGVVIAQADGSPLYIACRNIARATEHFTIAPEDFAKAEDAGEVIAIAHSHPFMSPAPSCADLAGVERSRVPWLIVNHPTGAFTITRPSGYIAPLVGRDFVHGVHDCYGLVRDYYAAQGILLNDYPRAFGWWNEEDGPDLYRDNFATEGFVQVPPETMREHDLVLMRIRAKRENHMAVYLGGQIILHHMVETLSRRDVYGEFFQRCTTAVLRHRSFI